MKAVALCWAVMVLGVSGEREDENEGGPMLWASPPVKNMPAMPAPVGHPKVQDMDGWKVMSDDELVEAIRAMVEELQEQQHTAQALQTRRTFQVFFWGSERQCPSEEVPLRVPLSTCVRVGSFYAAFLYQSSQCDGVQFVEYRTFSDSSCRSLNTRTPMRTGTCYSSALGYSAAVVVNSVPTRNVCDAGAFIYEATTERMTINRHAVTQCESNSPAEEPFRLSISRVMCGSHGCRGFCCAVYANPTSCSVTGYRKEIVSYVNGIGVIVVGDYRDSRCTRQTNIEVYTTRGCVSQSSTSHSLTSSSSFLSALSVAVRTFDNSIFGQLGVLNIQDLALQFPTQQRLFCQIAGTCPPPVTRPPATRPPATRPPVTPLPGTRTPPPPVTPLPGTRTPPPPVTPLPGTRTPPPPVTPSPIPPVPESTLLVSKKEFRAFAFDNTRCSTDTDWLQVSLGGCYRRTKGSEVTSFKLLARESEKCTSGHAFDVELYSSSNDCTGDVAIYDGIPNECGVAGDLSYGLETTFSDQEMCTAVQFMQFFAGTKLGLQIHSDQHCRGEILEGGKYSNILSGWLDPCNRKCEGTCCELRNSEKDCELIGYVKRVFTCQHGYVPIYIFSSYTDAKCTMPMTSLDFFVAPGVCISLSDGSYWSPQAAPGYADAMCNAVTAFNRMQWNGYTFLTPDLAGQEFPRSRRYLNNIEPPPRPTPVPPKPVDTLFSYTLELHFPDGVYDRLTLEARAILESSVRVALGGATVLRNPRYERGSITFRVETEGRSLPDEKDIEEKVAPSITPLFDIFGKTVEAKVTPTGAGNDPPPVKSTGDTQEDEGGGGGVDIGVIVAAVVSPLAACIIASVAVWKGCQHCQEKKKEEARQKALWKKMRVDLVAEEELTRGALVEDERRWRCDCEARSRAPPQLGNVPEGKFGRLTEWVRGQENVEMEPLDNGDADWLADDTMSITTVEYEEELRSCFEELKKRRNSEARKDALQKLRRMYPKVAEGDRDEILDHLLELVRKDFDLREDIVRHLISSLSAQRTGRLPVDRQVPVVSALRDVALEAPSKALKADIAEQCMRLLRQEVDHKEGTLLFPLRTRDAIAEGFSGILTSDSDQETKHIVLKHLTVVLTARTTKGGSEYISSNTVQEVVTRIQTCLKKDPKTEEECIEALHIILREQRLRDSALKFEVCRVLLGHVGEKQADNHGTLRLIFQLLREPLEEKAKEYSLDLTHSNEVACQACVQVEQATSEELRRTLIGHLGTLFPKEDNQRACVSPTCITVIVKLFLNILTSTKDQETREAVVSELGLAFSESNRLTPGDKNLVYDKLCSIVERRQADYQHINENEMFNMCDRIFRVVFGRSLTRERLREEIKEVQERQRFMSLNESIRSSNSANTGQGADSLPF